MKQQKSWLIFIVITMLLISACGLGGLVDRLGVDQEAIQEAVQETVSEQVEAISEHDFQEVVGQLEESTGTDLNQIVEQVSEAVEAEEGATQSESDSTTTESNEVVTTDESATGTSQGETVSLPVTNIQDSLEQLSSYEAQYSFETMTDQGLIKFDMGVRKSSQPDIVHLTIDTDETGAAQMNGVMHLEFYLTTDNDQTTMYMQNPDDQTWLGLSVPDAAGAFDQMPLPITSLDNLPPQSRLEGEETVNGLLTSLYTFNQDDFLDTAPGIDRAAGQIWISKEFNIPVKAQYEIEGSNSFGAVQFASYRFNFDLMNVNGPVNIVIPEEALASSPLGFPIPGSDEPLDSPFPLLDDAAIDIGTSDFFSYTTAQTTQAAWDFYSVSLPGEGWTLESNQSIDGSFIAAFVKDDQRLDLTIFDEGGTTRVLITVS